MNYLAELSTRGITATLNDSKLKLSAKTPPSKDVMALIEKNRSSIIAELNERDRQDQENIDLIKETFGAVELTGTEHLKCEYNVHLAKLRELESYLDDKNIPQAEREESLPAFKKLSHQLSDLLNAIGSYTHEEVTKGFEITNEDRGSGKF